MDVKTSGGKFKGFERVESRNYDVKIFVTI